MLKFFQVFIIFTLLTGKIFTMEPQNSADLSRLRTPLIEIICPLHIAAAENNISEIQRLLNIGFKINQLHGADNRTPLDMAVIYGSFEAATMLYELQDDKENTYWFLNLAAQAGHVELAAYFMDRLKEKNNEHQIEWALDGAARCGRAQIIQLFIERDIAISPQTLQFAFTALEGEANGHTDGTDGRNYELTRILLKQLRQKSSQESNNASTLNNSSGIILNGMSTIHIS